MLTGHGVDPALYDEIHDEVLDLFTSTPLEEKMRFRAQRHGSVSQGYFPIEETSEIHPDLVEGWVWCRRAFDIPQHRDAPFRAGGLLAARRNMSAASAASRSPTSPVQADRPGDVPGPRRRSPRLRSQAHATPISACGRTIIRR